jgi:proteasome lid subunit RPN8/RPN11
MSEKPHPVGDEWPAEDVSLLPPDAQKLPAAPDKLPIVLIPRDVQESMWRHALSETSREVGGVLIGRVNEGDPTVVAVEVAMPAREAQASSVHITFTADSWEHWHRLLDEQYAGRIIVGWYHSHPNHGVFLSGHDTFIQQNFFNQPWQVAVVVDPVRNEIGCFGWERNEIVPLPEDHVSPPLRRWPRQVTEAVTTAGAGLERPPVTPATRTWWLGWGVAIAVLIIAIMQTVSLARLSRVRDIRDEVKALRGEVSELRRQMAPVPASTGNWVTWRDGDSFEKIAERVYGRRELGEALEAINSPVLGSAGRPAVGEMIWVPAREALIPPPRPAPSPPPGR